MQCGNYFSSLLFSLLLIFLMSFVSCASMGESGDTPKETLKKQEMKYTPSVDRQTSCEKQVIRLADEVFEFLLKEEDQLNNAKIYFAHTSGNRLSEIMFNNFKNYLTDKGIEQCPTNKSQNNSYIPSPDNMGFESKCKAYNCKFKYIIAFEIFNDLKGNDWTRPGIRIDIQNNVEQSLRTIDDTLELTDGEISSFNAPSTDKPPKGFRDNPYTDISDSADELVTRLLCSLSSILDSNNSNLNQLTFFVGVSPALDKKIAQEFYEKISSAGHKATLSDDFIKIAQTAQKRFAVKIYKNYNAIIDFKEADIVLAVDYDKRNKKLSAGFFPLIPLSLSDGHNVQMTEKEIVVLPWCYKSVYIQNNAVLDHAINFSWLPTFRVTNGDKEYKSGDKVKVNDPFVVEFKANTDCYVYVLHIGQDEKMTALFPRTRFWHKEANNYKLSDINKNPVKKNITYRFPPETTTFKFDEKAGMEQFIFLAYKEKDQNLEMLVQKLITAQEQEFKGQITYSQGRGVIQHSMTRGMRPYVDSMSNKKEGIKTGDEFFTHIRSKGQVQKTLYLNHISK